MTPTTSSRSAPGLRERKKAETRAAIQAHALRLFAAKGYDATTVEEIAAAAGVSHMTFFRHFAGKADVVESDAYDPLIAEVVRSRPADEPPLVAIRRALGHALRALPADEQRTVLARATLILRTPALRARQADQQLATLELFADALVARGHPGPPHAVRTVAAAALAVLTTALYAWVDGQGAEDLADLVDAGFAALDTASGPVR